MTIPENMVFVAANCVASWTPEAELGCKKSDTPADADRQRMRAAARSIVIELMRMGIPADEVNAGAYVVALKPHQLKALVVAGTLADLYADPARPNPRQQDPCVLMLANLSNITEIDAASIQNLMSIIAPVIKGRWAEIVATATPATT